MFLEDQVWPKRCGHMAGKQVVPADEWLAKLRAAVDRRTSMLVCARTDARAAVGLDDAIERAKAAVDTGVDAVFVEAPETVAEMERIASEVEAPVLVANMVEAGRTPLLTPAELTDLGFRLVVSPLTCAVHDGARRCRSRWPSSPTRARSATISTGSSPSTTSPTSSACPRWPPNEARYVGRQTWSVGLVDKAREDDGEAGAAGGTCVQIDPCRRALPTIDDTMASPRPEPLQGVLVGSGRSPEPVECRARGRWARSPGPSSAIVITDPVVGRCRPGRRRWCPAACGSWRCDRRLSNTWRSWSAIAPHDGVLVGRRGRRSGRGR